MSAPTAAEVRSYFRGNLFDGDEGGVLTVKIRDHLDSLTLVVGFILEDLGLIHDAHAWDSDYGDGTGEKL